MTAEATAKNSASHGRDPMGWKAEGKALMRAIAAGSMVGMPLLYTMEMWWHGMTLSPLHLLGLLVVILIANFLFSLLSGFRDEYSVPEALSEAVTSIGIALVYSSAVLWLIGELGPDISPDEMLGKIIIESAAVSIGISFANGIIGDGTRTGEDGSGGRSEPNDPETETDPERKQLKADLKDASATLVGATVFALNVVPTEEIMMIALRLAPWQQIAIMCGSALLCYVILFASGLKEQKVYRPSLFQHPVAETTMTCALSLVVAFLLLSLMGQREMMTHPSTTIAGVVTLGLPAIVGGAAGRLIA